MINKAAIKHFVKGCHKSWHIVTWKDPMRDIPLLGCTLIWYLSPASFVIYLDKQDIPESWGTIVEIITLLASILVF